MYGEWVVEEDSHNVTGGKWRREKRVRKLGNTVLLYLTTDNRVDRKSKRGISSPFHFCDKPRLEFGTGSSNTVYLERNGLSVLSKPSAAIL